jgi:hypothetical protein
MTEVGRGTVGGGVAMANTVGQTTTGTLTLAGVALVEVDDGVEVGGGVERVVEAEEVVVAELGPPPQPATNSEKAMAPTPRTALRRTT